MEVTGNTYAIPTSCRVTTDITDFLSVEVTLTQHRRLGGYGRQVVGDDGEQHDVRQQHGEGEAELLARVERHEEHADHEDGVHHDGQQQVLAVEQPAPLEPQEVAQRAVRVDGVADVVDDDGVRHVLPLPLRRVQVGDHRSRLWKQIQLVLNNKVSHQVNVP